MREELWTPFLAKDYSGAARAAANILKGSDALEAIHVAGLALVGLDRYVEGVDWLCASLSLADAKEDWYANAAMALMDKKHYQFAENYLKHGIEKFPESLRIASLFGVCYIHQHKWADAIAQLDKVLSIDGSFYPSRLSRGFALHMLGQYQDALDEYAKIPDDIPEIDHEEVINNEACVYLEMGEPRKALAHLNACLPGSTRPATLYNKSFLYLGLGIWPEAWYLYRNRETTEVFFNNEHVPNLSQPLARTFEEINGKRVLLFHEQGLGDTLQFVRYAEGIAQCCSELTIGVPKALHRLVETMPIAQNFTVISDSKQSIDCDVAVAMLDAPAIFDQKTTNIPNGIPYFTVPDSIKQQRLLGQSAFSLSANCPKVGLVWAGSARLDNVRAYSIDRRRSIPKELFDPILAMCDRFYFVNLQFQNDRDTGDLRLAYQPIQSDFDMLDTAAIVEKLDLVITVDTAVAHLAGALGKTTWMLCRRDSCWRWGWPESKADPLYSTTPWYPTMRIYRQEEHNTWPGVIARVAADLANEF